MVFAALVLETFQALPSFSHYLYMLAVVVSIHEVKCG